MTAAKVSGAGTLRLMLKEVLPNCTAPLIGVRVILMGLVKVDTVGLQPLE